MAGKFPKSCLPIRSVQGHTCGTVGALFFFCKHIFDDAPAVLVAFCYWVFFLFFVKVVVDFFSVRGFVARSLFDAKTGTKREY